MLKYAIGGLVRDIANQIDEAQALYLEKPNSSNPTHSQLAKDHDDHPLHKLAASLASRQSREVGSAIQEAWSGRQNADYVVAKAAQYLVHPADIQIGGDNAWTLSVIRAWAESSENRDAIKRLSSSTWMKDWSQICSEESKKQGKRLNALDGDLALRKRLEALKDKK